LAENSDHANLQHITGQCRASTPQIAEYGNFGIGQPVKPVEKVPPAGLGVILDEIGT
jgi:hypothetical protein